MINFCYVVTTSLIYLCEWCDEVKLFVSKLAAWHLHFAGWAKQFVGAWFLRCAMCARCRKPDRKCCVHCIVFVVSDVVHVAHCRIVEVCAVDTKDPIAVPWLTSLCFDEFTILIGSNSRL